MRSMRMRMFVLLILPGLLIGVPLDAQAIEVDGVIEPHRVIKIGGSTLGQNDTTIEDLVRLQKMGYQLTNQNSDLL